MLTTQSISVSIEVLADVHVGAQRSCLRVVRNSDSTASKLEDASSE
jgi:hypothetical protein